MTLHEHAGKAATPEMLANIPRLITAYYTLDPDGRKPDESVSFGTSGHRGSPLSKSFNEAHVLAIAQAICDHRQQLRIQGPLFLGIDTHAVSEPALVTVMEVLAANSVEVMLDAGGGYTPTPAISRAILRHNQQHRNKLGDGIVITPSHNPPEDGGLKYNPPHGGPADAVVTRAIQDRANELLRARNQDVKRISHTRARTARTTHSYDYVSPYVAELRQIVDMEAISAGGLKLGVDPMGGAGLGYWEPIANTYRLNLEVVNRRVDPSFSFMTLDADGKIRMDCSSPYAMAGLIRLKDSFDLAFANDADADRHGIVTPSAGLLNPNHYLSVAIDYLFKNRPGFQTRTCIGKTLVSSSMIDRIAQRLNRPLYETPVGFKWFVEGLLNSELGFCGEESAGASFLCLDGSVWTTDKDGILLNLLAAEITTKSGRDPGELYGELTREFGEPVYRRSDVPATAAQKARLARLSSEDVRVEQLAGDPILSILTRAPGNDAEIGGLKVKTQNGWFAARPSGTEDIYKVYAESFIDEEHLAQIEADARRIVEAALHS